MKNKKTAVLVGATGATGRPILDLLLDHPNYRKVIVLTRRSTGVKHARLIEHIVDFAQPHVWQNWVEGDELFSALGTTHKQAGSKDAQYTVDVTYPLNVAKAARKSGINKLLLISSPGANHRSGNFYLRIKGELDEAVKSLDFDQCYLIKPSIIASQRPEGRPGERIGKLLLDFSWRWVPGLGKYRPISGERLASAIVAIANTDITLKRYEFVLDELFAYQV